VAHLRQDPEVISPFCNGRLRTYYLHSFYTPTEPSLPTATGRIHKPKGHLDSSTPPIAYGPSRGQPCILSASARIASQPLSSSFSGPCRRSPSSGFRLGGRMKPGDIRKTRGGSLQFSSDSLGSDPHARTSLGPLSTLILSRTWSRPNSRFSSFHPMRASRARRTKVHYCNGSHAISV
jgi:hypothetical protein